MFTSAIYNENPMIDWTFMGLFGRNFGLGALIFIPNFSFSFNLDMQIAIFLGVPFYFLVLILICFAQFDYYDLFASMFWMESLFVVVGI